MGTRTGAPGSAQVVIGLGNPGPAYRETRHNVGQAVVDRLASRLGARFRLRTQASLAAAEWGRHRLYLAKPLAFMNVVGPSVARLLRELTLDPPAVILVYDDLDLPWGRVRVRLRGRHGGHNGVRSLIETLGTAELRRVKVGVSRPATRSEVVDWLVTDTFSPDERTTLPAILDGAADRVLELAAAWTG